VGMEEVRGFAVTLGLGVAFSMLTALVITRWIFQVMLQAKLITKPLKLLQLIPKTNINWIGKRYVFWTISLVMLVAGVSALVSQGSDILGIEFSSGTQATVKFRDGADLNGQPLNDDVVRAAFAKVAEELNNDKLSTARVTTELNEKETAAGTPQTSYTINTTETDAKLLRQVVVDAFGTALERRLPCSFDFATGQLIKSMNVQLSDTSATWITTDLWTRAAGGFGRDLEDFVEGVMFVTEHVSPAITVEELNKRIRDMRLQQDFNRQSVNPYRVMGLESAGENTFSSFVVLVRPAEKDSLSTDIGRREFVSEETRLLTAAMKTEDAMVLTSFDASIAGQTAQLAIVVVVLSWVAIIAYLWLRFGSVQWGLAAVICLIHDVIIIVGLVALSGWIYSKFGTVAGISAFKIDLPMVAALLTVIGYSVNDTIVVFDRIRENRGKLKVVTAQAINESINQTLPRTLLTSMTTLVVVLVMYLWGGPGIRAFSYALLMGIIFGTYSSVAIASPLLLGFKQAVVARVKKEDDTDHDADLKGE
jgi:SecD/SecF fusion protein